MGGVDMDLIAWKWLMELSYKQAEAAFRSGQISQEDLDRRLDRA
jgi:hypothetical protein